MMIPPRVHELGALMQSGHERYALGLESPALAGQKRDDDLVDEGTSRVGLSERLASEVM
jgi:hypothetical protein